MAPPSDLWWEIENGYERGNVRIRVTELTLLSVDDVRRRPCTGVVVRCAELGPLVLAAFPDLRTGWEFANLLTNYLDTMTKHSNYRDGDTPLADSLTHLLVGNLSSTGSHWLPDTIIEDMTPCGVLKKMDANCTRGGLSVPHIEKQAQRTA